jgi:hypothetical protein
MYKRLTEQIRTIDQKHMIILEGYNWSNNWSEFNEVFDDNVVYQFHYYCWSNPDNLNDISHFLQERERLGTPVWVGETGERNPVIYFGTTQYFEHNNIGWAFWPWKKISNRQVLYSVKEPEGYDKIVEYSRGGEKPSKELAEKVFMQLLENIKIENCDFLEHISQSILRQVPARVYAVNYGHEGSGFSFWVSDTTNAEYYRKNEPVKTVLLPADTTQRWQNRDIAILLNAEEGTLYNVFSVSDFDGIVTLKAKANQPNSVFSFSVNGTVNQFSVTDTTWTELKVENAKFITGKNTLKTEVSEGSVSFLHFDVEKK